MSHYKINPTAEITNLCEKYYDNTKIDPSSYKKYDVKRGLRDVNGAGVKAGLTRISNVVGFDTVDGEIVPREGELYYRGIDINSLTNGFLSEKRTGFAETTFLLLFGKLPDASEYEEFRNILKYQRSLPEHFVRDVVMKAPSRDMMNTLAKCVLTLYAYDSHADDISLPNVLRQCLTLISVFPLFAVYGYNAYKHYINGKSLFIHYPSSKLSTAENILMMSRLDRKYTEIEAMVLDLALVLHMEHGGGNNSTFATHVVTSSGTDTYSAIAAALGSLKGPRHGGANIKVVHMLDDLKKKVRDWDDDEEIKGYLTRLLRKEEFDGSGLVYGMGHAVYSVSDPRAVIFKGLVEKLAAEKGIEKEYRLYAKVEELAKVVIAQERHIYKGVCANVDFYSGFAYRMLGIPEELYTAMFACARIVGWSAHRMEELNNANKIIRPAYVNIQEKAGYLPMDQR